MQQSDKGGSGMGKYVVICFEFQSSLKYSPDMESPPFVHVAKASGEAKLAEEAKPSDVVLLSFEDAEKGQNGIGEGGQATAGKWKGPPKAG